MNTYVLQRYVSNSGWRDVIDAGSRVIVMSHSDLHELNKSVVRYYRWAISEDI